MAGAGLIRESTSGVLNCSYQARYLHGDVSAYEKALRWLPRYCEQELTAHWGSVEANAKRSDIVARQIPVASTLLTTGMSEFETRPPT